MNTTLVDKDEVFKQNRKHKLRLIYQWWNAKNGTSGMGSGVGACDVLTERFLRECEENYAKDYGFTNVIITNVIEVEEW